MGDAEPLQQPLVPLERPDVEQHGARRVGVVGGVLAGQSGQHVGIDRPEAELSGLRALPRSNRFPCPNLAFPLRVMPPRKA